MSSFNIGAGQNYADLVLHRAAEKGSADAQELTLFDDQVFTSKFRYYSGDFNSVLLKPDSGHEFTGVFGDNNVRAIKTDGVFSGYYFQINQRLEIRDIEINGGTTYAIHQDSPSELILSRTGILSNSFALYNWAKITVNSSVIVSLTTNASYNVSNSAQVTANNSIFIGNNLYGAVRNRFGNTVLNGCLILNNHATGADVRDEADTLTGDYNISSDASAPGANSLHNQPISTWFVDAQNGDYRINETGQAVLKGKGPGGSDLLADFYLIQDTEISLTTKGNMQPVFSKALSVNKQLNTQVKPVIQHQQALVTQVKILGQASLISSEQPAAASVADVFLHSFTNAISTQQQAKAGLITLKSGGEHYLVTAEQLQLALTTSVNQVRKVLPVKSQQHQLAALVDVDQVLSTIIQTTHQRAQSGLTSIVELTRVNTTEARQLQTSSTNTIFTSVMPDLDFDSVLVISLSDIYACEPG
ncbi:hypothetical protein SG34_010635 [Thalassomonas viridans]|uniref:Uncharacterized protein n=1 Tax=Thalassomonas viridans TaxID=137584 RepID=A0AAF0C9A9_9GAMM|nr:hypothetical protein [Thalassomonas viridans]WDE07302.1 hypothetical protein SG34_010635 [Thalassomonas viridans]